METNDPVRDADVYYLQRDKHQERQAEEFQERYLGNLNDFGMFQSFLHDLDTDEPEVKLLFNQMYKSPEDKCYAYDNFITMYEMYVRDVTVMLDE